jgi:hypothetical protein
MQLCNVKQIKLKIKMQWVENGSTSEFQKGGSGPHGHPHLKSQAPVFGSASVYA